MANIRKTFNFRNGVQVDEDNLIVDSFGKVGIGTSIPTEFLDVRGTAKVVGLATVTELSASYAQIGVATVTELNAGGNILINSGVITTTSGIVTYYGDGRFLEGLPTSQWIDVDSGLGYTSIYAAGFVGVVTDFPYFPFQVGGNVVDNDLTTFSIGVGIGSEGNILATGIVTGGFFSGDGSSLTNLNASNLAFGTLSEDRLPTIPNNNLPSNISVSGIVTAESGFVGNLTGTASTAFDIDSSSSIAISNLLVSGVTTSTTFVSQNILGTNSVLSGITTIQTRLYLDGSIGIRTNSPQSQIHIFKANDVSDLQLTGETESIITLGRSLDKTANTSALRFGNTSSITFPYSEESAFDLLNYDTGSFNCYIHAGDPSGINTGNFNWIYGQSIDPLMSLTYEGNLGIGVTNPSNTLSVNGIGTFYSSLFVGDELNVVGNVNIFGSELTADIINATTINVDNINLTGPISLTGDQTVDNIDVAGITTTAVLKVNVNTTPNDSILQVNDGDSSFNVLFGGEVGLGTTSPSGAFQVGKLNDFIAVVVSIADTVGITTTIITGINTSKITPGLKILPYEGVIQDGTTVTGIGQSQVNISPASLNTDEEFNGLNLTFGTGYTDDYVFTVKNPDKSVGIGTTNPVAKLDVRGNTRVSGITTSLGGFTSGTGGPVQISVSGTTLTFTVPGVGSTSLELF